MEPWRFKLSYDKLIIALGSQPLTFGIHGVKEHAIFLREVYHAQEIRRKLLLNLMLSDVPGIGLMVLLELGIKNYSSSFLSRDNLVYVIGRYLSGRETSASTLCCCWRGSNWS